MPKNANAPAGDRGAAATCSAGERRGPSTTTIPPASGITALLDPWLIREVVEAGTDGLRNTIACVTDWLSDLVDEMDDGEQRHELERVIGRLGLAERDLEVMAPAICEGIQRGLAVNQIIMSGRP